MERIPIGKYTKEFREEAVKLVTIKGHSIDDTVEGFSLPKSTLANWIRSYKTGKLGSIGQGYRSLSETEADITALRKTTRGGTFGGKNHCRA